MLFEARQRLGGALALWANLPGRSGVRSAIDWWEAELRRLNVELRLGKEADVVSILIRRTRRCTHRFYGQRYSRGGRSITSDADISGHDLPFVYRPEHIGPNGVPSPDRQDHHLGGEGLHTSVGIAELLGHEDTQIDYVTAGFAPVFSARLSDSFEARFIVQRLKSWPASVLCPRPGCEELMTAQKRCMTSIRARAVPRLWMPSFCPLRDFRGLVGA